MDCTCTALVVSLTVIIVAIDFLSKMRGRMPPGPWGVPLVGYLPFLGTELHQTFAKLGIAYGPIYKLWLGNKMYVVLSSPDVVKEVVREKDTIFANRDAGVAATIVTYGKSDIAFRDYGPEWRKMRKIFVHKMLGNARLDASFELRKDVVEKSVKEVHGMIGEPVKIGCIGLLTVVNSMVAMIWGAAAEDGGGGGIDWEDLMSELMVLVAAPNVSDFFPFLASMDLQGIGGKMTELFDRFERVFEVAIERIRSGKSGGGKGSFLQYLMEMQDGEDHASSLTMTQIKAILMVSDFCIH